MLLLKAEFNRGVIQALFCSFLKKYQPVVSIRPFDRTDEAIETLKKNRVRIIPGDEL